MSEPLSNAEQEREEPAVPTTEAALEEAARYGQTGFARIGHEGEDQRDRPPAAEDQVPDNF